MKYLYLSLLLFLTSTFTLFSQEFQVKEIGTLEQIYVQTNESTELLPFNDLGIEFGYVLYQTKIDLDCDSPTLSLENVRDYATVYLDGVYQGELTDDNREIILKSAVGTHDLQLYVSNIGRITYGPEILDNSKGLFGQILLDNNALENWNITVLNVKDCNIEDLKFETKDCNTLPSFHRGNIEIEFLKDYYLDITGWGMGEVWINGNYIGSYWENEKQQSIQIPKDYLKEGKNEAVIFEMKNNDRYNMKIVDEPIFK